MAPAPMYDPWVDPVTEQAPAMSVRATLPVILLLLASPVAAHEARMAAGDGDGTSCSADYPANAAAEADPARAKRTESEKPSIPRGAESGASRPPRGHSFLPGMFR